MNAANNGNYTLKSGTLSIILRINDKKQSLAVEEEQSCAFAPEINPTLSAPSPATKAKGVDKFIERQRLAMEARLEKELLMRRDIGLNWVRKTTVPSEFRISIYKLHAIA